MPVLEGVSLDQFYDGRAKCGPCDDQENDHVNMGAPLIITPYSQ